MESSPATLPASMLIDDFVKLVSPGNGPSCLVEDGKSILGIVSGMDGLKVHNVPSGMTLGDLVEKKYIVVSEHTPLFEILRMMRAEGANTAIVLSKGKSLSSGNVVGVITRERIADLIEQSVASYEE